MEKNRKLIYPWWNAPGSVHSRYEDKNGKAFYDMSGWEKWADDPNSPPLHKLSSEHVSKYA